MRFIHTIRRFMSINKDYLPAFYLTLGFLLVNQGLVAYINYTIGNLTDSITAANLTAFGTQLLLLAAVQLLHLATEYQVNYRVNHLSECFVKRLRIHTYKKITNASMKWLDENQLGDIISRINGDLNALVNQINTFMTWQLAGLITFVVYTAACFFIHVKLSLVSFGIVPVLAILQFLTGRPIAKLCEKRSAAEGQANSVFVDLIGGLGIIKSFRSEQHFSQKYNRQVDKTVAANVKSFSLEFLMYPLQILMGYLPNIITLVFGSYLVINGELSIGMLFSYILLSTSAMDSIGSLSWQVRNIYDTIGISERIFGIWDIEEENTDGRLITKATDIPVTFEHIQFSYRPEQPVISNISFTVRPGEHIAIVGASGSGKSTVMKLLSGFYTADAGTIFVFGNRLEDWDKERLREHISYVGQDSFLFPGSIYSNVALGSQHASEEQILACIRAVGLDNLNLHTPTGERGVLLSGGQKQRVCVARALLKDADILLMDEPTSALDTESEYYVQQAVKEFAAERTCITIAHRLSTILHTDRILCMKDGQIVETGSHAELMERGGVYKQLYLKQQNEFA